MARASALVLACCLAVAAAAQDQPETAPGSSTGVEVEAGARAVASAKLADLESRRSMLKADEEVDAATKAKALETYDAAIGQLETALRQLSRTRAYNEALEGGIANEKSLREQAQALRQTPPADTTTGSADLATVDIERTLLQKQADVAALRSKLNAMDRAISHLQTRASPAREALSEALAMLERMRPDYAPGSPGNEAPALTGGGRELQAATLLARETEVEMLRQELASLDIRTRLRMAERELADTQMSRMEDEAAQLQARFEEQRQREAEQARAEARQARLEAEGEHPILGSAAEVNLELSDELALIGRRIEKAHNDRIGVNERAERFKQDHENARQRLEVAGLNEALGQVLSDQRSRLPDLRHFAKIAEERKQRLAQIGLRQLQISEARVGLGDIKVTVRNEVAEFTGSSTSEPSAVMTAEVEAKLEAMLADRRVLYEQLAASYGAYLRALGDLDFDHRNLIDLGERYRVFLDERLLWIPSASPLNLSMLATVPEAIGWLLSPVSLIDTGTMLTRIAWSDWGWTLIALVGPVVLFRLRRTMRQSIEAIAEQTRYIQRDSFWLTLQAIFLTLGIAGALPLLIGMVGWRLNAQVASTDYAQALGAGGVSTAWLLLAVLTLLVLCRRNGVAAAHFRWSESGLELLKRHFSWFVLIAGPAIFINETLRAQSNDSYLESLGRIAFMTSTLAMAPLTYLVLHPERGLPGRKLRFKPDSWAFRLRHVWFWSAVSTPVALTGLAATGYFYTAIELEQRLIVSVEVIVAAITVNYLVLRWLHVNRRRLEYKQALERRDAARAARAHLEESADGAQVPLDQPEVDIEAVDTQTRDLLKALVYFSVLVGLWLVWSDVLPALSFLQQVELWRYATVHEGGEVMVPVTLESLVLVVVLTALLATAAKNLPGVLEIAVLQRLPIDAGARYAFTSIARYVIVGAGVIFIFDRLGVAWGNVQWLVAALGVGLGFGLQEIFANFVSGLIILFERPIRIGDTVTVGNVSGTVTRIHIRAATIVDWDNKEIIVPNKTFITGQLINWTLSDPITRVVIPIGIAYGSDIGVAHRLISEVADNNPIVLEQPEKQLFFVGLGDSALNFELRVFVPALADRLPVTHELLIEIEKTLRENGISIPFPQRDVHVHMAQPARAVNSDEDIEALRSELGGRAAE
ncbi:MAG: mechanosensitive ion channel domain-containing protein [Gammaproteobacteria bacterium]